MDGSPQAERREFIRSVLRQFLAICAEREDVNSGADALDEDALTSVLVLAIHQLTYARFSPDRLFADVDQGSWQCSTASLSHLRTMLPESGSRPWPAKRPNHAT